MVRCKPVPGIGPAYGKLSPVPGDAQVAIVGIVRPIQIRPAWPNRGRLLAAGQEKQGDKRKPAFRHRSLLSTNNCEEAQGLRSKAQCTLITDCKIRMSSNEVAPRGRKLCKVAW